MLLCVCWKQSRLISDLVSRLYVPFLWHDIVEIRIITVLVIMTSTLRMERISCTGQPNAVSTFFFILPPPLSRDRRGCGGAMSHSIDCLFPLLTIHRVGVEVVSCQACPVDYVFQQCGTGPSSSPLAIHWPLQDSRRKVACSICVPVELNFPLLFRFFPKNTL